MDQVKKIDISKESHTKLKILQIKLSKYGKINLQDVTDNCIEEGLNKAEENLTRKMKEDCIIRQSLMCICGHMKNEHHLNSYDYKCTKSYCKCKAFESIASIKESSVNKQKFEGGCRDES